MEWEGFKIKQPCALLTSFSKDALKTLRKSLCVFRNCSQMVKCIFGGKRLSLISRGVCVFVFVFPESYELFFKSYNLTLKSAISLTSRVK